MGMSMSKEAKVVTIVGLGYVGLPLALLASKKGYEVVGVDLNEKRVDQINNRVAPYADGEVQEELLTTSLVATTS